MRTGAGGESTFLRFISNGESEFIDARERWEAEEGEGRERAEGGRWGPKGEEQTTGGVRCRVREKRAGELSLD